jgi:hypothetical protein
LLRRKPPPGTTIFEPYPASSVYVTETAMPFASTTE